MPVQDIKLDEALLAPKASATIATLMGDGVIPVAAVRWPPTTESQPTAPGAVFLCQR